MTENQMKLGLHYKEAQGELWYDLGAQAEVSPEVAHTTARLLKVQPYKITVV
jgi:hypothetical protein